MQRIKRHEKKEHLHEEIVTFLKLYILLYADDTIILAENPKDLQASLDEMKKYCDTFDLHINVNKTKILIFSTGKLRRHHIFNFGEFILDTVEEYNYLGLVFNYNALKEQNHNYIRKDAELCLLYLKNPEIYLSRWI